MLKIVLIAFCVLLLNGMIVLDFFISRDLKGSSKKHSNKNK
ncbi:MAG: hypothetical protein BWZ04_01610 [Firmicutes bacterium ADurb.BinA205]|nr:MAG: hypothetical protein BWZ04_01610 [Firmicutes bacterium ADurb.BinA205]